MEINVQTQIWEENDKIAEQMSKKWRAQGTFVFNLLGSPGAGKTTFLETTLDLLPYLKYDLSKMEKDLKDLNPTGTIRKISSQTQDGMQEWIQWLIDQIDRKKSERV